MHSLLSSSKKEKRDWGWGQRPHYETLNDSSQTHYNYAIS